MSRGSKAVNPIPRPTRQSVRSANLQTSTSRSFLRRSRFYLFLTKERHRSGYCFKPRSCEYRRLYGSERQRVLPGAAQSMSVQPPIDLSATARYTCDHIFCGRLPNRCIPGVRRSVRRDQHIDGCGWERTNPFQRI